MRRSRRRSSWGPVRISLTAIVGYAALFALAATVASAEDTPNAPTFSAEEIDQVVAPIALYPDSLLAQVLMASTYPLEVVEAARFAKENPSLKDTVLDDALKEKTWDPSVKSLVAFPQVLTMMNEKLDWTQKLGDAFLAQQSDVMDGVQRLRSKAKDAGNLESTKEQNVTVEAAPAPPTNVTVEQAPTQVVVEQAPPTVIRIEQTNPQVVYVPTYNPTVVYGAWPYPAYPPYYYYPPGYVMGASMISFGVGMAVGASLYGGCNWGWGHGDVDVDVNRYNNFNSNVNNNYNKNDIKNKVNSDGKWKHDPSHRKGVQYRDKGTQQRYDRSGPKGADSREQFRGRADQGRKDIKREGTGAVQRDVDRAHAGQQQNQRADGARDHASAQDRAGGGDRAAADRQRASGSRDHAAGQQRGGSSGGRSSANRAGGSGAYQGVGQGSQVRRDSSRGHASRSSASASRGGGSRGGMGGGGRAGGGGGRPGGGGGRRR